MKKRLRIIIIAFCVSFGLMMVFSAFALRQFLSLADYSAEVDHTNRVINRLYEVESLVKELDVKERGYIIMRDSMLLYQLHYYVAMLIPAADSMKTLLGRDRRQQWALSQIRLHLINRRENIRKNIQYLDSANTVEGSPYLAEGRTLRNKILTELDTMRNRETTALVARFAHKKHYQQTTYTTILNLIIVFGIITVILFILMLRELVRRVRYQDELQQKLADLSRSNNELEQIAHAISHNLQEPIRKIRIFSDRILRVNKCLDTESKDHLERIDRASARMQHLITDLTSLTSLMPDATMERVNLNKIWALAKVSLNERIDQLQAQFSEADLPSVSGYPHHLRLLFRALLDNALKFSREGVPPQIRIRTDEVDSRHLAGHILRPDEHRYYRISITDNGIGFDNQFISKMFQIFQRLHNQQSSYSGQGIGLAMCQRIMVNHRGFILANGIPNQEATFFLFFPIPE